MNYWRDLGEAAEQGIVNKIQILQHNKKQYF